MLAAGSDPVLKALAKADINATSIDEKIKVADGWWDYAQHEKGIGRDQILARAAKWYREVSPKLQGLAKAKAEKRLAEIATEPDDRTAARKPDPGKPITTLFKDEKQIKDYWKMPDKWSISAREGVVALQQQTIESKFTISGDCIIQIACTGRPRIELYGERLSSAVPPNNVNGQDNIVVRPDQGVLIQRKGNKLIVKTSNAKFDSTFDIKEAERNKPSRIKISGNWYVTILAVEVRADTIQMDPDKD
jgi:F0F1-type ATP synthase epsilon subunit